MMELPLRGIIPPVVTPLIDDNELDEQGTENLINHILEGGVHGIFLLGTTGEATSLRYKVRERFVKLACRLVNKKVPVLVGITDTSFDGSVEMAHFCRDAGADMVVVAPPYYFPISQHEMRRYLDDLVPRLPLPFLLYNMPSHTKLHMSLKTVEHAKELGALGIKDSSGDMLYLLSLIDAFKHSPEFSVITGTEIFIPETYRQKRDLVRKVSRPISALRQKIAIDLLVHTEPMSKRFFALNSSFAREIRDNGLPLL